MDIFSTKRFVRAIADEMEIQGDPRYFTEAEVVKAVNLAFKEHKAINNYDRMKEMLERANGIHNEQFYKDLNALLSELNK